MEETRPETNAPLRVLLVDDDVKLTRLILEYLQREGMVVSIVHDGEGGVALARGGPFDIVVLDVMLPGIGGFEVLRRLRASGSGGAHVPVLMLSARGEEVDRVLGLELGADDYLSKPFSSRELAARLRAIVRRAQGAGSPTAAPAEAKSVRVGDVELDAAAREVRQANVLVDVTSGEFDILEVLMRSAGEIVKRETISTMALGRSLMPYDRSIDVHIHNLRRKLGNDGRGHEYIKAVRGVGYIFVRPRSSAE